MHLTKIAVTIIGLILGSNLLQAYTVSQSLENGEFTVVAWGRGQSFTLSDPGDGGGSLLGSQTAFIDSFTFRFQRSNFAAGAAQDTLMIFDSLPANPSDITTGNALFVSTGSFTIDIDATWTFENALLDVDTEYFALLSDDNQFRYSFENNPYGGGRIYYEANPSTNPDTWVLDAGTPNLDAYFTLSATSSIPEPSTYLLLGFGLLPLFYYTRKKR